MSVDNVLYNNALLQQQVLDNQIESTRMQIETEKVRRKAADIELERQQILLARAKRGE